VPPPPTQATPGDAPDTPQKAARRGPSLGRFITSVRDLVQRNPVLSLLSVVRSEAFMAAARSVMEELEKLRPEITEFADNADRFTKRLSEAKASELAATGQSALADFVLPLGGGITLCPSGFTFAVNRSSRPGHVYMILSYGARKRGAHSGRGRARGLKARMGRSASAISAPRRMARGTDSISPATRPERGRRRGGAGLPVTRPRAGGDKICARASPQPAIGAGGRIASASSPWSVLRSSSERKAPISTSRPAPRNVR